MKTLIIDFSYNGLDMAECLASLPGSVVVLYPSTPITHLAPRLGCQLLDREAIPRQALGDYIQSGQFDRVINLSPVFAFGGIEQAARTAGTQWLGTTEAFAHTEIDKLLFKRFLQEQQLPTPDLRFMGKQYAELVAFVEKQTQYPLVIKACQQLATKTRVCQHKAEALDFIQGLAQQAQSFAQLVVENYIPAATVLNIEYLVAPDNTYIYRVFSCDFAFDARFNRVLPRNGYYPYEGTDRFRPLIEQAIEAIIARWGAVGFGGLQAIVSAKGKLYFTENNARLLSYSLWSVFADGEAVLQRMATGSFAGVCYEDLARADRAFAIGGLLQAEGEQVEVPMALFEAEGVTLFPAAIMEEQGAFFLTQREPTFLIVAGDSVEACHQAYTMLDQQLQAFTGGRVSCVKPVEQVQA